jgi:hypothetical protein
MCLPSYQPTPNKVLIVHSQQSLENGEDGMGLTNTVVKLSEFNEENHKAKEPTHHNRKNGVHHVILSTTTIPSQNVQP